MPHTITQDLFGQLGAIQSVVYGVGESSGVVYALNTDENGNLCVTGTAASLPVVDAATGLSGTTAPLFATQIAFQNASGILEAVSPTNPLPVTGGGGGGGTGGSVTQGTSPWVVSGTVAVTGAYQATQPVSIATMPSTPVTGTFYPYSLGQQLAAASVPVVLTAAQLTTLTPPAVFGGVVTNAGTFAVQATLGAETTKVIGTVNIAASQTVGLVAGSAVIGHVINDASSAVIGHVIVDTAPSTAVTNAGTFAVQAVLGAETTKVIGTVNQGTSPWVTSATLNAETTKVIGTVNIASAQTLATVSTVTAVTSITNAVTVAQGTAASLNATVTQQTLTKGTQGATGITVQELKDAGRNNTMFYTILPIVTTSSEALLSLTGFKSDAAVATTTTPAVVTSGKKFRITNIAITYVAIATAGSVRMSLRKKVGGTVVVTDPVIWSQTVGAPAAVAGVSQTVGYAVDMEINAGDGIGVSQLGLGATQTAAAVGYGSISIYGYEY